MLFFSRPGHKILSKSQCQVTIFIFKTRTKYIAAKKKLKKKSLVSRKFKQEFYVISSKTRIKQFKH